ncbi:MAG: heparan-alpha-glucosaminide N-acetyltransferase domain-containing protein [Acidimicrobiia bacterium]
MSTTDAPGPRLVGLDRLRGAALLLMLVHHLTGWFGRDGRAVIPGWDGLAVTDVAAVAFTVALGASVPLLLASRARRGQGGWRLAGTVVRRYGLLIPIGVALRAALGFDLDDLGVLETLGICALVTAVVVRVAPATLPVVASGALLAAPAAERAGQDVDVWVVKAGLTGMFPLVAYLGFALLGAACAPHLGHARERATALAASVGGVAWTAGLVLAGDLPDRYPGEASYLVPGLTGTALLYLAVTSPRLDDAGHLGAIIRRAGAHTFGIFVGHYGVYLALRETGRLHDLSDRTALAVAIVTAVGFAFAAARMPTLPWSPRTGWARPRTSPRRAPDRTEPEPVAAR